VYKQCALRCGFDDEYPSEHKQGDQSISDAIPDADIVEYLRVYR
jgi:hypothetical protein